MTTPNLNPEGLRALAEKATQGPWAWDETASIVSGLTSASGVPVIEDLGYDGLWIGPDSPNAAFIAAANPATVLALLDENERMREALSVMSIALERIAGGNPANTNSETAKDMSEWSHCVAVVAMCNPAVVEARAALSPTQPEEVK